MSDEICDGCGCWVYRCKCGERIKPKEKEMTEREEFLSKAEQILRQCYMGELPSDPWVLMAQGLIAAGLRAEYERGKNERSVRRCR